MIRARIVRCDKGGRLLCMGDFAVGRGGVLCGREQGLDRYHDSDSTGQGKASKSWRVMRKIRRERMAVGKSCRES